MSGFEPLEQFFQQVNNNLASLISGGRHELYIRQIAINKSLFLSAIMPFTAGKGLYNTGCIKGFDQGANTGLQISLSIHEN